MERETMMICGLVVAFAAILYMYKEINATKLDVKGCKSFNEQVGMMIQSSSEESAEIDQPEPEQPRDKSE